MSYPNQTQATPPDANAMLTGGGNKFRSLSFNFPSAPVWYRGATLLEVPKTFQSRDDDGDLEFWDGGEPKWVIAVRLQLADGFTPSTEIINEYGSDDGTRVWYVSGRRAQGSRSSFDALASALRKAGAKNGAQPGAVLDIGWVDSGPAPSSKKSGPKFYEVIYTAPPAGYRNNPTAGMGNGQSGYSDPLPPEPDFDDSEAPF
jgi:hypothetical protein